MAAEGGYDASIEYACNHAKGGAFSTVQTLYQSIVNQLCVVSRRMRSYADAPLASASSRR
jgi:hypothetical protein